VSIEADVIEEIARFVGYGNIAPAMPAITMRRFEPHALHELEQRTIGYFSQAHGFHEIHGYLWYDDAWLRQINVAPGAGIELRNPAAEGLHRLRSHLMPGLLAAAARNRFYFDDLALLELGSVFADGADETDTEHRNLGLVLARRSRKAEEELLLALKGAVENWAWERFARPGGGRQVPPRTGCPWDHAHRTAEAFLGDAAISRVSVIDASLRRAMDEHLSAWAIAWAEVRLSGLEAIAPRVEALASLPAFPLVELDFSFLVPAESRYADVVGVIAAFRHELLKCVRYLGAYQGEAVADNRRSLTFRVVLGDDRRTLTEADTAAFRAEFEGHLSAAGHSLR
jgi:phenylalanyl-tRNA synthetase beta chain